MSRPSLRTVLGVLLTLTVLAVAMLAPDDERASRTPTTPTRAVPAALLPPEAGPVLERIAAGGPFEDRQDGAIFGNREGLLPDRPRGHYREYTVPTPASPDRGARRIVTGGDPPTDFFYTDDHYDSFQSIPESERP